MTVISFSAHGLQMINMCGNRRLLGYTPAKVKHGVRKRCAKALIFQLPIKDPTNLQERIPKMSGPNTESHLSPRRNLGRPPRRVWDWLASHRLAEFEVSLIFQPFSMQNHGGEPERKHRAHEKENIVWFQSSSSPFPFIVHGGGTTRRFRARSGAQKFAVSLTRHHRALREVVPGTFGSSIRPGE